MYAVNIWGAFVYIKAEDYAYYYAAVHNEQKCIWVGGPLAIPKDTISFKVQYDNFN